MLGAMASRPWGKDRGVSTAQGGPTMRCPQAELPCITHLSPPSQPCPAGARPASFSVSAHGHPYPSQALTNQPPGQDLLLGKWLLNHNDICKVGNAQKMLASVSFTM